MGLVEAPGTTEVLSNVYYTIEGAQQTVNLLMVPLYCEHTRIQVMISATRTDENGNTASLTESQIAGYGIVLNQSQTTPTLTVYSTDVSLIDYTFDLAIASTATEETTWRDIAYIKI